MVHIGVKVDEAKSCPFHWANNVKTTPTATPFAIWCYYVRHVRASANCLDLVFTHPCIFGYVIINQAVCFPASSYMFVAASKTNAWITYHFVPVLEVFTHGLFIPTMSYFMRVQNVWIVQLCMNPNASMPRRLLLCREVSCLVIMLSS